MLDSNQVISAARQPSPPANWRVWRGRAGYCIWQMVLCLLIGGFCGFGLYKLLSDPNSVYILCPGNACNAFVSNDATWFLSWRIFDFAAVIFFGGFSVIYFFLCIAQIGSAGNQVLVLTREGLVMDNGKKPRTISFASVRSLGAVGTYGVVNLTYFGPDGKRARFRLDSRFGNSRSIARAILQAYNRAPSTAPR